MATTDPIADMLTRIRNANLVYKPYTDVPSSKLKGEIARLLKREGFIRGYKMVGNALRIYLKYTPEGKRVITNLQRVSKPGCRVYKRKDAIPRVLGGLGIAILSTSKGILTDKESRLMGVGGEVLCYVW
ncbi:MAG TPA: 30S ribosomal protein S8 [Candidatus Limnocylindrales bacterium]|nr:30S ribosomal protein S8 [Candidatus Limnocylindrales bacterium]